MSKKAVTIDLSTGQKKLEIIVDSFENAHNRDDIAYSAKAVDSLIESIQDSNINNYYNKDETYNRTEVDEILSNVTVTNISMKNLPTFDFVER